jgi:hypothetical protein
LTKYDVSVLQNFADTLYEKASFIIFQCASIGLLIGVALPGIPLIVSNQRLEASNRAIEERPKTVAIKEVRTFGDAKSTKNSSIVPLLPPSPSGLNPWVLCIIGGVLGGGIGCFIGQRKGFQYRLQAQVTLCQMQIEHNTHPALLPTKSKAGFVAKFREQTTQVTTTRLGVNSD